MRRILGTEGRTRMNIQLSAKLLRDLKIVAAETGRTLSRVTEELLMHGIKTCSTKGYPVPDEKDMAIASQAIPTPHRLEPAPTRHVPATNHLEVCDSCGRSLPANALAIHRENCRAAAADQEWGSDE